MLIDSNSNADALSCVDMKLFNSYIGAALPLFTRSHHREYCHRYLLPRHGAAIRDFRFGAELWFFEIILFYIRKEFKLLIERFTDYL